MQIEKAAVAGTLESSDCTGYGRRWGWQHRSGTGKYSDSSVWKSDPSCVLDTLEIWEFRT